MRLEDHYKQLAAQAVEFGPAPFTHENIEERMCFVFGWLVNLEESLERDDIREVQNDLAEIAFYVLAGLHQLCKDSWCLRSPKHEQNKYRSPGELTRALRFRARDVYTYWRKGMERDTEIALELVLKSCIELASTLEFDLAMAVGVKLRALRGEAPHKA